VAAHEATADGMASAVRRGLGVAALRSGQRESPGRRWENLGNIFRRCVNPRVDHPAEPSQPSEAVPGRVEPFPTSNLA
jgi:hypothetical protein